MIDPEYLADLRRRAASDTARLTGLEVERMATFALSLGHIARSTARGEHIQQALDMLSDAAPTLALELRRMLQVARLYSESLSRETA